MIRFFAIFFLCANSQFAKANPMIVSHPAYMSSEQLGVRLTEEVAEISGRFHFRSTSKEGDPHATAQVSLEIPIWVPCDPKEADAATAILLRSLSVRRLNSLDDSNRGAWDAAVGLKIHVGDRRLDVRSFAVFESSPEKNERRIPDEWCKEGFYCIYVRAQFQPEWLANDPEIRLQYRQGLRRTSKGNEFHYVPVFKKLPDGHTTKDLSRYSMHLLNASDMPATLGSAGIPAGYSTLLPLAHHQPITITLRPKD